MKSIKKLFAILMITALMVSCFAINASAISCHQVILYSDGDYAVFDPNGTDEVYEQDDAEAYLSSHGITWDGKTLTLNNTVIEQSDIYKECSSIFYFNTGVTDPVIVVKGTCSLSSKGTGESVSCGIMNRNGNITVKGDGTLKIAIEDNDYGVGIWAVGNLTVCESVNLDIDTCCVALQAGDPDNNVDSTSVLTIKDFAKVDASTTDTSLRSSKDIVFEGKVQVNALSDEDIAVNAYKEIIFKLDNGGKVSATTNSTASKDAAFIATAPATIILNRDDGTDVTYPVGGKETKISNTFWAITESDGKTYAKKATVECKKATYEIKESADEATWTKGGTTGQKITSTADFSKFVSVSVDDKVVDAANYDKAEGSTIITFKPAYLETLSVGKHTVVITSKDGSATGTLTIKEAPTPTPEEKPAEVEAVADTADTNAIGAFVALSAFAAAGFVTLKKKEN